MLTFCCTKEAHCIYNATAIIFFQIDCASLTNNTSVWHINIHKYRNISKSHIYSVLGEKGGNGFYLYYMVLVSYTLQGHPFLY